MSAFFLSGRRLPASSTAEQHLALLEYTLAAMRDAAIAKTAGQRSYKAHRSKRAK
jgi:hypothetical protein